MASLILLEQKYQPATPVGIPNRGYFIDDGIGYKIWQP